MDIFSQYQNSINFFLAYLHEFIEETTAELFKKQEDLDEFYKKIETESEEERIWDHSSYFNDRQYAYNQMFPAFMFNSMLVTQFAFFERYLRNICITWENTRLSKIKISDLTGSDIKKYKKYLALVVDIDTSSIEAEWQSIHFFQKLRNSIIHRGGAIEDPKLILDVKKHGNLYFDEEEQTFVIEDTRILNDFTNIISSFFNKLIPLVTQAVQIKIKTANKSH